MGTNTLRLLIGEVDGGDRIRQSHLRREITRLGGGFDGRRLHPEAKARTLRALRAFAADLEAEKVTAVRATATSVVREAEDGAAFIDEIKRETGLVVEVIPGEREAALTLRGVLSALDGRERRALVFDIGGGSTEYIVAEGGEIRGLKSLNMGVVSLTERLLRSDPPSPGDLAAIGEAIDGFLLALRGDLPALSLVGEGDGGILVGTAGTITTLAALDQGLTVYDSRRINNYILSRQAVEGLFGRLAAMTHDERAALPGLEAGRADLIIAGTLIVLRTLADFDFSRMVVSDYGLLEGLLLDLADGAGGAS